MQNSNLTDLEAMQSFPSITFFLFSEAELDKSALFLFIVRHICYESEWRFREAQFRYGKFR